MSMQHLREAIRGADTNDDIQALISAVHRSKCVRADDVSETAQLCFEALCGNTTLSSKRRWIGIMLCKLVDTDTVANYLQERPKELEQIGPFMLQQSQPQVMRMILGILISKAGQRGIDFRRFWPTPTVPDNSVFPGQLMEPACVWFHAFQEWIDELHALKVGDYSNNSIMMFPVSLILEQTYMKVMPVAILQDKELTLVLTEPPFRTFELMDILLSRVNIEREPATLVNPEGAPSVNHDAFQIIIRSSHDGAFRLNENPKSGVVRLNFRDEADAKHFESCVEATLANLPWPARPSIPATEGSSEAVHSPPVGLLHSSPSMSQVLQDALLPAAPKTRLPRVKKTAPKPQKPQSTMQREDEDVFGVPSDDPLQTESPSKIKRPAVSTPKAAKKRNARQTFNTGKDSVEKKIDHSDSSAHNTRTPGDHTGLRRSGRKRNSSTKVVKNNSSSKKKASIRKRTAVEVHESENLVPPKPKAGDRCTTDFLRQSNGQEDRKWKARASQNHLSKASSLKRKPESSFETGTPKRIKTTHNTGPSNNMVARLLIEPSSPSLRARCKSGVSTAPYRHAIEKSTCQDEHTKDQRSLSAVNPLSASTAVFDNASGQTPVQHPLQRTSSLTSASAKALSSNSKPIPASPHAESTAISGHAVHGDMDVAKELGGLANARSDPFLRPSQESARRTKLYRRLTGEKISGSHQKIVDGPLPSSSIDEGHKLDGGRDMDDETTLVAPDEPESLPVKASSTSYPSSPPKQFTLPSSHSSTSAIPTQPLDERTDPLLPIEAQDQEWEANLKPHQLAIEEELSRITKRVLQHVVDSEVAVKNVAELYEEDGKRILGDVRKRRDTDIEGEIQGLRKRRKTMKKDYETVAKGLAKERKIIEKVPEWLASMSG